jgi:archaetidylinositol phosphate synthase
MPSRKSKKIRTDITKHKRQNPSFLGFLERPALGWLSTHMPRWVTPDMLTIFGFLSAVLIGVSYALSKNNPAFLWLASFGFFLNWFGDSLDGTLARKRNIERPKFGFFIDHTTDALAEVIMFVGLGLSGYVDMTLALIALVGYFLMSIMVYIYTYACGTFRIAYIGLGPTEFRAIAIIANVLIFFIGNPIVKLPFFTFHLYDAIVAVVAAILYGGYIVVTIVKAIELAKQEIIPPQI